MEWLVSIIRWLRNDGASRLRMPEDSLHIDTERMRHRRELVRFQGQARHHLAAQTTVGMAPTQTRTGGS